jgi:hypothetical protein
MHEAMSKKQRSADLIPTPWQDRAAKRAVGWPVFFCNGLGAGTSSNPTTNPSIDDEIFLSASMVVLED